jgi:hypothetical protein
VSSGVSQSVSNLPWGQREQDGRYTNFRRIVSESEFGITCGSYTTGIMIGT